MDMRRYRGKYLLPERVLLYQYSYFSHAAGGESPAKLSVSVGRESDGFVDYEYELFITPSATGRIESIERLKNGYLIKKFPEGIDAAASAILDDIVDCGNRSRTSDLSILVDKYGVLELV